jgi:preprotein translocase subunit SecG
MKLALNIVQIVLATALILSTLLQVKGGSGLGGIFGGSGETVYRTKRGVEKWLFWSTIIITALFIIVSLGTLILT